MPTFFRLAQTSCNLVSWASHFDVNVKKYKNPKYEFGTYAPVQDLRWHKGRGSCLECGLFEK